MTTKYKTILAASLTILFIAAGWFWFAHRLPPQLPPDDQVFSTVDALFTAITAHDPERLAACEQRLAQHAAAGTLPQSAARHLQACIATARAGDHQTAAQRLYRFMEGQRRQATVFSPL